MLPALSVYMSNTVGVFHKKQKLFTISEHLSSSPVCWWDPCWTSFKLFFPIMFHYILSSILWRPLRFPHRNDVWFALTSRCSYNGLWLIYVINVCLRLVVSNTYCVVLLFCFSSYCIPYAASFSKLSLFIVTFGILSHLFVIWPSFRHPQPNVCF